VLISFEVQFSAQIFAGWLEKVLSIVKRDFFASTGLRVPGTELTRGPPESSNFADRGSSHRRKSATCHKFDKDWLYRSPIPLGRRGVISSFILFLPACPRLEAKRILRSSRPQEICQPPQRNEGSSVYVHALLQLLGNIFHLFTLHLTSTHLTPDLITI
jgi:hypothetical protein